MNIHPLYHRGTLCITSITPGDKFVRAQNVIAGDVYTPSYTVSESCIHCGDVLRQSSIETRRFDTIGGKLLPLWLWHACAHRRCLHILYVVGSRTFLTLVFLWFDAVLWCSVITADLRQLGNVLRLISDELVVLYDSSMTGLWCSPTVSDTFEHSFLASVVRRRSANRWLLIRYLVRLRVSEDSSTTGRFFSGFVSYGFVWSCAYVLACMCLQACTLVCFHACTLARVHAFKLLQTLANCVCKHVYASMVFVLMRVQWHL